MRGIGDRRDKLNGVDGRSRLVLRRGFFKEVFLIDRRVGGRICYFLGFGNIVEEEGIFVDYFSWIFGVLGLSCFGRFF